MSLTGVTRELLVRYLDTWAPTALHSARRATFVQAWSGPPDLAAAEAALRVFAEFADRLRGRQLTVVLLAPEIDELVARVTAVQAELGTPAALSVHPLAGDGPRLLPAALTASSGAGAPLLACLDITDAEPGAELGDALRAVRSGRPGELLLVTSALGETPREALLGAGFPLTAAVELVTADEARQFAFATSTAKTLEAFKNQLWAVDEFAGVRLRDPRDPDGREMDISLTPNPAPLRRELLAHLSEAGPRTVTELRHFTLTDTVYRAADTNRALVSLLAAGSVTREPDRGRLAGDVTIATAT